MINSIFVKEKLKTRTGRVLANISASVMFKMINMVISFLMVPITLNYLDKTRYGLWAAISSLLAWFFIFDIGIGNGLRNKYTELKAKGDFFGIKQYVSTAYFIFGVFSLIFVFAFILLDLLIDWSAVLNAPDVYKAELQETISVTMILLSILFVTKLINTILSADLKNSISDGLSVVAHVISFIGILIISRLTTPSILKYALLYTGSNLLVSILASVVLYRTTYKAIAPSVGSINFKLLNDLVSVGANFFFLQIASMALFHSTSFIISSLVDPMSVTVYNITQKYFSLVAMVFSMMVQPLWTGYAEAYYKGEFGWIRKTFARLMRFWIVIVFVLILMGLLQSYVFRIWLHEMVQVDICLSILFIVYFTLQMINAIYNPFINATAKLRLTLTIIPFNVIIFLGLSILFTKQFGLGSKGVLISIIFSQGIPAAILGPIQSYKILNGDRGIWGR